MIQAIGTDPMKAIGTVMIFGVLVFILVMVTMVDDDNPVL